MKGVAFRPIKEEPVTSVLCYLRAQIVREGQDGLPPQVLPEFSTRCALVQLLFCAFVTRVRRRAAVAGMFLTSPRPMERA